MTWTAPAGTSALIFDCDGTLADTMPLHFRAWTAMLEGPGLPMSEEQFYELGGVPTAKIIALLAEAAGRPTPDDLDRLVATKEEHFLNNLEGVTPVEVVKAIAAEYRGKLPMAVASGGYRDTVQRTLAALGVADWFAAVVCAEDTPKHKPEPDVFLEAARRLGVPPTGCAVFEDTDIGLQAARAAGMIAVDVRPWLAVRG